MTSANATATPAGAAPTWGERLLGTAAYPFWAVPPFFLMPLLIFWWKSKTSRFAALHAVQSVLLAFASMFLHVLVGVVWMCAAQFVKTETQDTILMWTALGMMGVISVAGWLGMPFVPLLGRPAALPVLGRWAQRIMDSPPAESGAAAGDSAGSPYTAQGPKDRLLAGAAYLSIGSPGLFFFGPLAVYFWKRRSSRFVALHALQALLLHAVLIPVMGAIFFGGWLASAISGDRSRGGYDWGTLPFLLSGPITYAAPTFILWRGFAAMLGPPNAAPLLGRMARWIAGRRRPG